MRSPCLRPWKAAARSRFPGEAPVWTALLHFLQTGLCPEPHADARGGPTPRSAPRGAHVRACHSSPGCSLVAPGQTNASPGNRPHRFSAACEVSGRASRLAALLVPSCTSSRYISGVDAPVQQGARREHTGSIRPTSNAAGRDAAAAQLGASPVEESRPAPVSSPAPAERRSLWPARPAAG